MYWYPSWTPAARGRKRQEGHDNLGGRPISRELIDSTVGGLKDGDAQNGRIDILDRALAPDPRRPRPLISGLGLLKCRRIPGQVGERSN